MEQQITFNKYNNSKIYKIISPQTTMCYIGSTYQDLNKRMAKHIYDYKKYKNNCLESYHSSYDILKYEDAIIELIEGYYCESYNELKQKENEHILLNKPFCINDITINIDKNEYYKQWKSNNINYFLQWRNANKDLIQKYNKQYYNTRIAKK